MIKDTGHSSFVERPANDEWVYQILIRVCGSLGVPVDRSQLSLGDLRRDGDQDVNLLVAAGKQVGVTIRESTFADADEVFDFASEGYPIILNMTGEACHIVEGRVGRNVEVSHVAADTCRVSTDILSRRALRNLCALSTDAQTFIAKEELECHPMSAHDPQSHGNEHDHEHPTPLRRFLQLLRLDRRDIWMVALFALVSGILSLATPLAIESLVNVVSWGTYWQPLLVLALMLLACLGLSGVLKVLQTVVVEIIQRRQLVRIVADLAHRFPRANQSSLSGEFPRELANRVFDIMTIQKATAILLLDGVSLVLTTSLGLLLLAFYHPILLGYDMILLALMLSVTWILGRGGIRTAIVESLTKYRIAHWLQDVLASPTAFKINGGESLAIDRANRLASEYLVARKSQFAVIIRQVAFAVGLQVVASTVLLGLGGWLVIRGQLTLGQLVASELVVTVVVGAFAKAGKSLEKFYDLMAGVEKVGHLLDIPVDPRREVTAIPDGAGEVHWDDLKISDAAGTVQIPSVSIVAGSRVAVVGDDQHAKSTLLKVLAGLAKSSGGIAEVAGIEAQHAGITGRGKLVGYAGPIEIFHASLRENVDLGRTFLGRDRVRHVLENVGLWDEVLRLQDGLGTRLQTGGYPLTRSQAGKLMIARAIAASPSVVLIDGLLDEMDQASRKMVWEAISGPDAPWTLIVSTNRQDVAQLCEDSVTVSRN